MILSLMGVVGHAYPIYSSVVQEKLESLKNISVELLLLQKMQSTQHIKQIVKLSKMHFVKIMLIWMLCTYYQRKKMKRNTEKHFPMAQHKVKQLFGKYDDEGKAVAKRIS